MSPWWAPGQFLESQWHALFGCNLNFFPSKVLQDFIRNNVLQGYFGLVSASPL